MQSLVDPLWAMKMATKFFEKYHSGVLPIEAFLDEDVWRVTVSIESTNKKIKQVMIDANTGKILDYY